MNWEAVGAVGEIVGAIAVVMSLVYLASQIRIQNRESRASATHEILEAFRNEIAIIRDPDMADLLAKARSSDYESLTEPERIRYIGWFHPFFRVWEEAYYQHKDGRLDSRMWESMVAVYADAISVESNKKVWELRKHVFTKDFREFVASVKPGEYLLK